MGALKVIGGLCAVFAAILVILTLFIAIGLVIRIIAIIAAVVGILLIFGALVWLAIEELFLKKNKAP